MNLEYVDQQIRKGLPDQAQTWEQFNNELAYYLNEGHRKIPSRESEQAIDKQARPKLALHITHKVVNELAKGLYAHPGPCRKVTNSPEADLLFQAVAKEHRLNRVLHRVDKLTYLHGVCGVQVVPHLDSAHKRRTGEDRLKDPKCPVRFRVWPANQFTVWTEDCDPSCPWAVVTRSFIDGRERLQLWTDEFVRTYMAKSKLLVSPVTSDQFDLDAASSGANPFGVIPFVFAHNEDATDEFWTPGLGHSLVNTCFYLDQVLSDLTQAVETFCIPEKYSRNLSVSTRMVHRPGDPMDLMERDPSKDADVFFRQPELAVEPTWMLIERTVNETLEGLDVPIRMSVDASNQPESGIALTIRRIPIIDKWRIRQDAFKHFECKLARLAASVAAASVVPLNSQLLVLSQTLELEVDFPEYSFPIPSVEKDASDDWELQHGLTDEIQIMMERYNLTESQAIERFRKLAVRKALLAGLLPPPAEPRPPALRVQDLGGPGEFDEGSGPPVVRGQVSGDESAAPLEAAVPTVFDR